MYHYGRQRLHSRSEQKSARKKEQQKKIESSVNLHLLQTLNEKQRCASSCACVCVCVRDRERERWPCFKGWTYLIVILRIERSHNNSFPGSHRHVKIRVSFAEDSHQAPRYVHPVMALLLFSTSVHWCRCWRWRCMGIWRVLVLYCPIRTTYIVPQ